MKSGRVPSAPGSREPSPQAVSAASGFDPSRVWSKDLTDNQLRMVMESGENQRLGDGGFGVELRGASWATARALVAKGLGTVEGGAPNGSSLPGLYFNNEEGVRITHEFDEDEDDEPSISLRVDCRCAAPELYEALIVARQMMHELSRNCIATIDGLSEAEEQADAALAKVGGE